MSETLLLSLQDVSLQWPSFTEIFQVLTLQAGFNAAVVVLGTSFLGFAAGIVGTFTLLRGRALMGDALAHSSLPGIALMFLLLTALGFEEKSLPLLLIGATLSGLLGVAAVQGISRNTRLHEDTAIGAVLSVFFGAGIVLLSYIQGLGTGSEAGLHTFIYGQTAAITQEDALLTFGVALFTSLTCLLFLKEFRLVCFDREFAESLGWSVSKIDLVMMALLVLVTVIGLQSVGLILVIALLIVPAAAARFWTEKLQFMIALAGVFGLFSGYLGATLSALLPRLPAGAVIVLTAGAVFTISFLFAPCRGTLHVFFRHLKLQYIVHSEHLLRELYEQLEQSQDAVTVSERGNLKTLQSLSLPGRFLLLKLLSLKKYVEIKGERIALTGSGHSLARKYVRNHRLWEQYLITFADIAVANVDRLADFIEHSLPEKVVSQLEQELIALNKLPAAGSVPASVHRISAEED